MITQNSRRVSYPRKVSHALNATTESWSAVGDRDELAASFDGWDARVVRLLEAVETCFWWGLYDHRWTHGPTGGSFC
jgi:hypothetical protein